MLAAVALLFQTLVHLGEGHILFTGSDEGGDAPLQIGVLIHGQSALADKSAAGKHLTADPQQLLAQILRRKVGDAFGGSGKGAGEFAHWGGGAQRVADDRIVLTLRGHVHPSTHSSSAPRRVAILVRQHTAVAGGKTVQHRAQKRTPSRLSGFIGGINEIQPRLQLQRCVIQFAESRRHTVDAQNQHLLWVHILYMYSIT